MIDIFELLVNAKTDEEVNELYDMTFDDMVKKFGISPRDIPDVENDNRSHRNKKKHP